MKSNAAWMIPLGLFYLAPTIVACSIWFFPESPRWLVLNDRLEEGKKALHAIRHGKFTEEEIDSEFSETVNSIQAQRNLPKASYTEIFQGTNLRRTLIICTMNFFLAGTGTNFANSFGAYYIQQMDYVNPFTVTLCSTIGVAIISLITMLAIDRMGRRFFPIAGAALQTCALFIMGALGTVKPPTHPTQAGVISMMQLCILAYSAAWAPAVHIISVELVNTRLRDYTYRTANVLQVLIQYVEPLNFLSEFSP